MPVRESYPLMDQISRPRSGAAFALIATEQYQDLVDEISRALEELEDLRAATTGDLPVRAPADDEQAPDSRYSSD